jgi:hypothetical protein
MVAVSSLTPRRKGRAQQLRAHALTTLPVAAR